MSWFLFCFSGIPWSKRTSWIKGMFVAHYHVYSLEGTVSCLFYDMTEIVTTHEWWTENGTIWDMLIVNRLTTFISESVFSREVLPWVLPPALQHQLVTPLHHSISRPHYLNCSLTQAPKNGNDFTFTLMHSNSQAFSLWRHLVRAFVNTYLCVSCIS